MQESFARPGAVGSDASGLDASLDTFRVSICGISGPGSAAKGIRWMNGAARGKAKG